MPLRLVVNRATGAAYRRRRVPLQFVVDWLIILGMYAAGAGVLVLVVEAIGWLLRHV